MGTTDANGIYMYSDTDPLVPFASLLNTGQASVSAKFASVDAGTIHYVANTTERDALAATFNPSTSKPLFVYRANAAPGARVEYSTDGSAWTALGSYPQGETSSGASNVITATAFANLPNTVTLSVVLPVKAKVEIVATGWASVNNAAMRFGTLVSGATAVAENSPAWGAVGYVSAGGGSIGMTAVSRKVVELNAGTNTITLRAYIGGGGSGSLNYPTLSYKVLAWV